MKKILSFICVLTLLCTVLAPLSVIEVSAANFSGWTLSNGAYVEDGILYMISNPEGTGPQAQGKGEALGAGTSMLPDQYTISFSMKATSVTSASGLQGGNGLSRAGFYFRPTGFKGMDSTDLVTMNYLGEWHDFTIEVDHIANTEKIYLDEEYKGTIHLGASSGKSIFFFFCNKTGGEFEVSDFKISVEDTGGEQLGIGKEYTQAFRQDFDDLSGWMIEPGHYVTHYPDEGIIRLYTPYDNGVYRSIECPLRPTTNYDMEFRIKIMDQPEGVYSGKSIFELSAGSRHTWLYVFYDKIQFNDYGSTGGYALYDRSNSCVMLGTHDSQWHTWKAEVRGDHITWYIDGKELINLEMLKSQSNRWHFTMYQQNSGGHAIADFYIDYAEYTPYFEDEVTLIAPIERSVFAETKDIEFKADVAGEDVEKVDYYVNDVLVGSGYKEDDYVYTLKNAKVGQYKLKAKVENIETQEMTFTVKKAFSANFKVDKNDIHYGGSVKATVTGGSSSDLFVPEKVDFYLNGRVYATDETAPFETTYTGMQVGTGAVYARAYSKLGTVFETTPQYINVDYVEGKALEIGREYTIDYKYTGGNGKFELKDGYFALDLAHNGETVTYKTDKGEKVYEGLGYGDYKIVVTSGYAELYWNHQFVCSFFFPYAPSAKSVSYSGLSDVSIKGSGVKAELFHTDWEGKAEFAREDIVETKYYSVEFDKTDSSPEVIEFCDGTFENVISFREDGIYAKQQLVKSCEPSEVKLSDKVEPGYYRLTVGLGIAQLNLNNITIAGYRCNKATIKKMLTRTMTNPSASTFIAVKNSDDVYYHNDTFEEITEITSDEYWTIHPLRYSDGNTITLTAEKRTDRTGNHYMNIKGKGVYLLNGMDQYPSFKWRGMVQKREGKVYTMLRRSYGDRHDKIGYDFDKNQWFYEMVQENGSIVEADAKPDPNAYKEGQWYNFEIICEGYSVKLLCDGKEVFSTSFDNDFKLIYYGRLGFAAVDSEYNFDDVEYKGKNKVSPGFHFTSGGRLGTMSGAATVGAFYKGTDGAIYATDHAKGSIKTTDRGRTWIEPLLKGNGDEGRISSSTMVVRPDGSIVHVLGTDGENGEGFESYVSYDNGLTWHGPFLAEEGYGNTSSVARISCTMNGRVFVATTLGHEYYGKMYVFYSDDGMNWTKSETDFNTDNTGIIMNEAIVIDTPRENEVWFVARSDSGFIDYWVSKDGGQTFDLTPHHTGLMQSQCCFRIQRDWNNPDTYYAFFNYDTETADDRFIQQPRNRSSLAVSYDGMQTWHYICDVMEANDNPGVHTSDGMLYIIDDQLYWRTTNYAGYGGIIYGVQDIDKAKVLMRMPELHYRKLFSIDSIKHLGYEHVVLPKADGEAFIYGDYYHANVSDGRTDLDTVKKAFGVEVTKTGSTVTLSLGGSKVTFTEGSTSYVVNDETRTAERAVYQGGMLDIKVLAETYGKVFRETEDSYCLMFKAELIEKHQTLIDNLA